MSIEAMEQADLSVLVEHVVEEHATLRRRLLDATRLAGLHGAGPLADAVDALAGELGEHMLKEERVLLPWIRAGRGATAVAPIRAMTTEHEHTLAGLSRIRQLTNHFRAPTRALEALYAELAELERFLEIHIAFENNVLFPRALRS